MTSHFPIHFDATPISIVKQLVSQGYEAYIVGGAVRDTLLHRDPKDYDITTNATPEQIRQVFGRRFCHIIGRRFRLALLHRNGEIYEISTFRREPTANERRSRPSDNGMMIWNDNHYGTLDDDIKRRDFTVNALYCDVAGDNEIIDKTGGLKDLKTKIVHAIGDPDKRFQEDPVRMLRALKLVGQHNFSLARNIQTAIHKYAPMLELTSSARRLEEISKILNTDKSLPIFEACHKHHLLAHFSPVLEAVWETPGGEMIRNMLTERDECLKEDPEYFSDRSLAFATLCVPYILSRLELSGSPCLSSVEIGHYIREFFTGYELSHELTQQIQSMICTTAQLAFEINLTSLCRSRIYPLAYELFRLITMASGWQAQVFNALPYPFEMEASFEEETPLQEITQNALLNEKLSFEKEDEEPPPPKKRRRKRNRKTIQS